MAGALAYLLGTIAHAARPPKRRRPRPLAVVLEVALGLGAVAATLLVAGRALSWTVASCLALAACGGLWGANRTLPDPGLWPGEESSPPLSGSDQDGGSVFDQWDR